MTPAANLLVFLALALTMLLVWRQSRPARRRLFMAQSAVLALLAAVIGLLARRHGLLVVATVFAVLKLVIIPHILRRMEIGRALLPAARRGSTGLSLLVTAGLIVVAYVIMLPVTTAAGRLPEGASPLPTTSAIPLAFAMALIGLHLCVAGRDAVEQILGFLVLENGIFGVGLLATYGLPGLVEAGVFLEVLVIALVMEGVVVQIRRAHDSIDVERLRELRG
jgi:hydrogenase-4 component E